MGIIQNKFSKKHNITEKTLYQLINASIPLAEGLAEKLSNLTGTSLKLWLNLQQRYDKII